MNKVIIKTQFKLYFFLIVIAFIGDIFRRLAMYSNFSFTRYTTLSKIIFISVSFFCLVFFYRKFTLKDKLKVNIIKLMLCLSLIYVIGHFNSNNSLSVLYENFEFLAKYFFLPYLLILFIDLRNDGIAIERLIKLFEVLFFINLGAILVGYVFNVDVFQAYDSGKRFGYKGIYSMSGQTQYLFHLNGFILFT